MSGLWSFRHDRPDRNILLRLSALRVGLQVLIEKKIPGGMAVMKDLCALNLLRIIPYCRSQPEQSFIEQRLHAVMNNTIVPDGS